MANFQNIAAHNKISVSNIFFENSYFYINNGFCLFSYKYLFVNSLCNIWVVRYIFSSCIVFTGINNVNSIYMRIITLYMFFKLLTI